jgi:hypothetical protein
MAARAHVSSGSLPSQGTIAQTTMIVDSELPAMAATEGGGGLMSIGEVGGNRCRLPAQKNKDPERYVQKQRDDMVPRFP